MIKSLKERLLDQAAGLAIMAEMNEVIAAHFRPRYIRALDSSDAEAAGRLYHYVIERDREGRQWRREEADLREAAASCNPPQEFGKTVESTRRAEKIE